MSIFCPILLVFVDYLTLYNKMVSNFTTKHTSSVISNPFLKAKKEQFLSRGIGWILTTRPVGKLIVRSFTFSYNVSYCICF